MTVPLRYTVALPMYMLPTSTKVTWRTLPFPLTVRFAEVIWMFPQYTPGDPHGDVAVVTLVVTAVVVLVVLTVIEVEVDVAGVVEVELCSLALETLDETPEVVVTVDVVTTVDVSATVGVVVEVTAGAPEGKLALASTPSRTATMTAAPAPAPTFPY